MIKLEFYFPKDGAARIVLPSFICHVKPPAAAPSRNAPGTRACALSLLSVLLWVQLHSAIRGGGNSESGGLWACFGDADVEATLLDQRCSPLPTTDCDVLS